MYDKSTYTSLNAINEKISFLKDRSGFKYDFDIAPFQYFASMRNQAGRGIDLFPQGIPHLIGATSDCLQCYYGFQLDTYMNGCTHECVYCWAKAELSKIDQWNSPVPVPIDISSLWELFYKAFETDEEFPLREVFLKRVPLRIGSMSDPFLSMEKKYKNTLETLKILKAYNYPFLFLTRSPMVAEDEYLKYMDPEKATVQFSIPTLNEYMVKLIEPGTESPYARLEALKKLNQAGVFTSVRLNPLFPNFPDGHLSGKKGSFGDRPAFDFFNPSMIEEIRSYGCKNLLAGFVHMDGKTTQAVSQKVGFDLRSLMKEEIKQATEGFKYSVPEIRSYYEAISQKCKEVGMDFSTCYLGLGESYFWKDQDLWADKKDCCNLKKNVPAFKSDTRELSFTKKMKILYPEMNSWQLIFNSGWLYRMRSYLLKNLWD